MTLRAPVIVAVLVALAGVSSPDVAAQRILRFQTPSRNIGCGYAPASTAGPRYLRCDIRSGLNPAPRRRCTLDWVGMVVGPRGRGRANCAGDTIYSAAAPVLAYGRTWRRGGFTCLSRRTGLTCRNRRGHGFLLARAHWRAF